jgi:hypothetical protein
MRVARRGGSCAQTVKEENIGKKADEFEKDYGHIRRYNADDQGKP